MSLSVKKIRKLNSNCQSKVERSINHRRHLSDYNSLLSASKIRKSVKLRQTSKLTKIERNLHKELHALSNKEPVSVEKFKAYKQSFEIIIQQTGSVLLRAIKDAYDSVLLHKTQELELNIERVSEMSKAFEDERVTGKQLKKRFKMLALDNIELNHQISLLHNSEKQPQEPTKDQLKLAKAVKKYRDVKLSHTKLVKLVDAIRAKGVPVDEIFDSEVNVKHQIWLEVPSFQDTSSGKGSGFSSQKESLESIDFNGVSSINESN